MIDPAFWRGRRVLVTGHTGFKGSWLTLWLNALGAEVIGLALEPVGRSLFVDAGVARDCASHVADVRDAAAVRRVVDAAQADVVFHLAAQALVRPSYAAATDTWSTNVMGTVQVLDALLRSPAARAIVVVTSDKCYEHGATPRPFVEDDALGGHDPYSASKAAAEIAVASWRRSFFAARGAGVATARAGNVIGGGDWAADRLIPDLVRSVVDDVEVTIRSPHATRPWQHVLEPLRGYLMLAECLCRHPDRFAGAWNFGPADDALAVHRMAERFERAMEGRPRWRADANATLHEASHLSLSIAKAGRELGWSPLLTVDEAIALTASVYRAAVDDRDQRPIVVGQIADYQVRFSSDPAASREPALAS